MIFPLEITQSLARFYTKADNLDDKRRISSTALLFTFITLTVPVIFGMIFYKELSVLILENNELNNIYLIAIGGILGSGLIYFIINQLRWRIEPKKVAIVSITSSLASILFSVFFVLVIKYGVYGFFLGQLIGNIIGFGMGYYYSRTDFGLIFDRTKLKILLNFSYPLVFSTIGVYALRYVDRIFIKSFLNLSELGIYGIGYRFASITTIILSGFGTSIVPLIFKESDKPETPKKLANIFRYYFFISLIFTIILSIYAKEYVRILTTPEYYSSAEVIPFLVIGLILFSFYMFFPGLYLANKTKIIALLNIISGAINIGLNFLLIPTLGILGTAIALMVSALVQASIYYYYSQKYYKVPHFIKEIIMSTTISVPFIITGFIISFNNLFYSILFKTLILLILSFILIFTKIITFEEVKLSFRILKTSFINVRDSRNIFKR
jgi:O-antigen/teichoic acid export membrane protein